MTSQITKNEGDFDLQLGSGRVRCRRVGSADAPLSLCVHGLSAHMLAFDHIVERLGKQDRHRVRRLIMIDHAGQMDPDICSTIIRALERLDIVVNEPSAYVEAMRLASGIAPWSAFWDRLFPL